MAAQAWIVNKSSACAALCTMSASMPPLVEHHADQPTSGSSSHTRMRGLGAGWPDVMGPVLATIDLKVCHSGSSKKKVVPAPTSELKSMRPPMRSTMTREMFSPRPVPPFCRVSDESACENFWKMRLRSSSGMPEPWSLTSRAPVHRLAEA